MTAHEPIKYLDSILNEEEKRCEYSHEWRNFTISRSGRFKSKNKKRDTVNRKLFDGCENMPDGKSSANNASFKDQDKTLRQNVAAASKDNQAFNPSQTSANSCSRVRDKVNNYKSYCETNL